VAYYKSLGVTVTRVMTDNGSCYQAFAFRDACRDLGTKHISVITLFASPRSALFDGLLIDADVSEHSLVRTQKPRGRSNNPRSRRLRNPDQLRRRERYRRSQPPEGPTLDTARAGGAI
jgi:hypothetical protein